MEALDTLVEMNPIRIAVRQADETSIKILLSGGMGAGFLKSWRPSFPMLGLAEISHSLAITQGSILHYAVAFKPEQFVLALLYFGVAINQEDDQGQTPLHVAVLNRQPSMMKLLLSRGADVNARNSRGSTPYECLLDRLELYCDAQQMDVFGVALQMVDRGANINSVNLKEHSLLYLAVKSNNSTSFVMSVLKKDASIRQGECWNSGKDSLYAAAFNGNYVLAKVLVDHDVKTYALTNTNLNAHWDTLYRTIEGQLVRNPENYDSSGRKWELEWFWAASIAACRGHKEVVKLFLRYGIPVNFFDRPGHTLLFTAIEGNLKGGRENMVRMLLTMGARADVRTISGETPWTSPVTLGWEDTVDLLLIHGVDVDFTDGKGRTPLHLALGTSLWDKTIYSTTNRIAQRFLSHGCQVNIPDHEGNTALHLAARLGKWSLLKTILQACKELNAPVDPRNHRGQTPLDICKIDSTTSKFRAWVKGSGLNDISVSNDS
jgi:ankyrin repeat protein